MRASAYRNKGQKEAHAKSGDGPFSLSLSLDQDEAASFVKGEKTSLNDARKALKKVLESGPSVRAASNGE
jgi:hypothetical protein